MVLVLGIIIDMIDGKLFIRL